MKMVHRASWLRFIAVAVAGVLVACPPASDGANEGEGEGDVVIAGEGEGEGEGEVDCVHDGDVTLSDDDDVASLRAVCIIDGDVVVSGERITALTLPALERITGRLSLDSTRVQTGIDAPLLSQVGGSLSITHNGELTELGLRAVSSVGGVVRIVDNGALRSLLDLGSLADVGGGVIVTDNALLEDASMSALSSIGGDLVFERDDLLSSLDGLTALTEVRGGLSLREMSSLTSLDGFSGVSFVSSAGHDLTIIANGLLQSLDGLAGFHTAGRVEVAGNATLNNVNGLQGLSAVDALTIAANPALETIVGFAGLSRSGPLRIAGNTSLVEVGGFASLDDAAGIDISGNPSLVRIAAFDSLQSVAGDVSLQSCEVLSEIELGSLAHISGALVLRQLPTLPAVNFLSDLVTVSGEVRIENNHNLRSISGLDSLTSVGADFVVAQNPQLSGPQVLPALTTARRVSVDNNACFTCGEGLCRLDDRDPCAIPCPCTGPECFFSSDSNQATCDYGGEPVSLSFPLLARVEDLSLSNNAALADVSFPALTDVDDDVIIVRNRKLLDLDGLSSLARMDGLLDVEGNSSLVSVRALLDLERVGGDTDGNPVGSVRRIRFFGNDRLPACQPFTLSERLDALCSCSVGVATISAERDLEQLTDCTTVPSLQVLGSTFTDLTLLRQVRSVPISLQIANNPELQSLAGLEGLNALSQLSITNNSKLESIDALRNVAVMPSPAAALFAPFPSIEFRGNPRLAQCRVDEFGRRFSTTSCDCSFGNAPDCQ